MLKFFKENIFNIINLLIATIAIFFSALSIYLNIKPEDTKLTIKYTKKEECFSNHKEKCYQLFIYNNDKAPCFEFELEFDKNEFEKVLLLKNYEKSNLFNAIIFEGKISFPAMIPISIDKSWLGYLEKKQIAYFAFFPNSNFSGKRRIRIKCVDFFKEIAFE